MPEDDREDARYPEQAPATENTEDAENHRRGGGVKPGQGLHHHLGPHLVVVGAGGEGLAGTAEIGGCGWVGSYPGW